MSLSADNLDWSLIRAFLAVAEAGSLSAAARKLGQSQPTLGRHIKAAEAVLGVELFQRVPSGLALTDAGAALVGPARQMAEGAARLTALVSGQETELRGTVRITASVVVSHFVLPRIMAELRRAAPQIEVELVPTDGTENLIYREADIAVRMYRPTQLDVVTRHVGDAPVALYAAPSLLERFGVPRDLEALARIPFVGFDRSDLILRHMRAMGMDVDRHFFGVRCDDQAAFWQLVCAGCGIGGMQVQVGEADARVVRVPVDLELPSLPVWLAAQGDVLRAPRVRAVWDALVAGLKG
ncbi:MAG: LysR family transcriptional regulator [Pseudomonadota bacterium]